MPNRFQVRGTRSRTGDGYSSSKTKSTGGLFRSSAVVTFEYSGLSKGLDASEAEISKLYRALESNKNIKVKKGAGFVGSKVELFAGWRKDFKSRIRQVSVRTTEQMEKEMLSAIGNRIETNLMRASVRRKTEPSKAGREVSRVGWLSTWRKYFGFQEEGTVTGIKPMKSLIRAVMVGRMFASKELSMMAKDLRSGKGRGR